MVVVRVYRLSGIVEQKDASPAQCEIREINTGFIAAPAAKLRHWVEELGVDGFRIDLAGQIDKQTLIAASEALPEDLIMMRDYSPADMR